MNKPLQTTKYEIIGPRSCDSCFLRDACGGLDEPNLVLLGCSSRCCGRANCDYPCLSKPNFAEYVREVRGMNSRTPRLLPLAFHGPLPAYIPVIRRNIVGIDLLEEPWVALTFDDLFRGRRRNYHPIAENGADLRAHLGLHPATRIILMGVARDKTLERYWQRRLARGIARQIARLGIEFVTCPNFSYFPDAPKFATLWNRHRMICVMEELVEAGVRVVPHVNAIDRHDWEYWERLLIANPEMTVITKEFGTGLRDPDHLAAALNGIRGLEQRVGRRLHLIADAGARLAAALTVAEISATIVDSTPFIKAVNRQARTRTGGWVLNATTSKEPLTGHLMGNINGHRDHIIAERARARLEMERSAERRRGLPRAS